MINFAIAAVLVAMRKQHTCRQFDPMDLIECLGLVNNCVVFGIDQYFQLIVVPMWCKLRSHVLCEVLRVFPSDRNVQSLPKVLCIYTAIEYADLWLRGAVGNPGWS